ncbi:DUF4411 family protein [Bradyrhizobium sp. INPA03-11B]|uniref:DUF4411 family protein n=1 Tax=Bradyrhizobium sp. INPA03-11B TaxID=418598 RepID=UPI003390278E
MIGRRSTRYERADRRLVRTLQAEPFPKLWEQLDQLVTDGRLVSSTLVLRECNKQRSEELHGWLKSRETMFITPDEVVQRCSSRSTTSSTPTQAWYRRAKSQPVRHRVCQGASLNDRYRGDRHRQHRQGSGVCNDMEVNCINLIQLIVAEDWVLCDPMFTDRSTSNKHQTDCTHRYSLGPRATLLNQVNQGA